MGSESSITSEFGYCWITQKDVTQSYTLDLYGKFEIGTERKAGSVCIGSTESFDKVELGKLDEFTSMRKEYNLGKIELRHDKPNAFIKITSAYLKHIWELCNAEKYLPIITFTIVESVLQVREVESILVEVEKREVTKKRGIFG